MSDMFLRSKTQKTSAFIFRNGAYMKWKNGYVSNVTVGHLLKKRNPRAPLILLLLASKLAVGQITINLWYNILHFDNPVPSVESEQNFESGSNQQLHNGKCNKKIRKTIGS